ncbi:AsnC family transcriptional regulator [Anaeroselena agilis]|uniref:siroheme decarboxylase n=1 Tax=Anaeroselena agilis TaxID=3063788 RepID=A0ABU3P2M1_9FIRM|nr:AsnC family transcriptional regulator [Selenomonadales bacterium 4137-cl]
MLNDFDKRLLNIIQSDIPLVSRPFAALAERLGADEGTVIDRLRFLRDNGFIRRIGPFFDSGRLGYVSTLVALAVEPDALPAVAAAVNAYPGVTHNYEREGKYNLWFALLSPHMAAQERVLAEVAGLPGIKRLLNLPATKKFKVNVRFTLE